jgi:predicted membrane protein
LARKRYSRLYVVGAVIMLIAACSFLAMGFASPETMEWSGAQGNQAAMALPWFVTNIVGWTVGLFVQVLVALIVPAAVIGARLADTDIVTQPDRHRRLLISTGIGGLALGALAALHSALANVLLGTLWPWDFAVKELFGIVGACGWLALLALYAGGPTPDGRLTGLRRLASAVGRRSMTVYLSQTILFGTIFVIIPVLATGERLWVGEAAAALIAVVVWLVTVVLCTLLERGGHAGPFETLLRTAVVRSERKRAMAPPPAVRPADARSEAVLSG